MPKSCIRTSLAEARLSRVCHPRANSRRVPRVKDERPLPPPKKSRHRVAEPVHAKADQDRGDDPKIIEAAE